MTATLILAISTLLQLATAAAALWPIRLTKRRLAWGLLSAAFAFLAIERGLLLYQIVRGVVSPPMLVDALFTLIVSILMLAGVVWLIPVFRSIRHNEQALRENEQRYRHLAEATREGILVHESGLVIDANPAMVELSGYPLNELIGLSVEKLLKEDSRELILQQIQKEDDKPYEHELIRRDGSRIAVEVFGKTMSYEGRPVRVTTIQDLTLRKETEASLRMTQFAVDNAAEAVYWIRPDGRFVYVNRAACQQLGYTASELLSLGVYDIDPNFPRERWPATWQIVLQQQRLQRESIHRRKDGSEFPVEIQASVLEYENEIYFCAYARDITERKRAAQALQEAHDQLEQRVRERTAELTAANERLRREVAERKRAEDALRAKTEELRSSGEVLARLAEEQTTLLRHTRDFLYRHDRHGVFTYLSPAVESLTGYTVEEWKTHYTTYLTDNPLNEKVREYTEETLRTGRESPPYRVAIRHKQGHEVILEVNERPYFEDGEVAGIIGVARDITDRVRAEEDLKRAKEAAEAANRAKTAFLANVSHEIRTPLTAMLAAAELFAANADPVQRERYADPILTNGRHLLNLIDDLLDLSQAESGRLDIVIRSCSLPELVGDVLSVVSPLHRRPSVELSVRYETPVPAWIRTDPTRLKQAVINLLANALKFTREGIVQLRIRVDRDAEEPRLRIVVRDSGPGIDPRDRERIFQAFVKGDAERTSTPPALSGGVGLGLPLTRWIAGQLGGDITVDSKPGAGSTFTLRVRTGPLDHAEWVRPEDVCLEPKLPTSLGLPSARYQGRVLLADDFDDTRRLIEEALTSMGVEVVPAADGEEAVRHALRESFDLILMDLRMPRVDGMEATRRLRKQGCLVPIIALTASTTADDEDRIREAGFDGLWRKPIELSELVSRIGDYLRDAPSGAQGRSSIEDRISPDARGRLASIRREFALSLPARVDALREAWKAGRRDRVREILHQLIGSSGIHGFPAVSEEAARIQARVKRNGLDAVESLRTLERLAAEAAESQRQPPSSSSPPTPA